MDASDIPIGLRYGLPIETYHGDASSISKSGLDLIARSPYHYWARCIDPQRPPPPEPTPAMRIGTMTHTAILEPAEFSKRYAIGPNVSTKAAKGWKDFVATLAPGVEPIIEAELAQVLAMAVSVQSIAPLRDLLAAGQAEVSAFWLDAPTGVLCRCRPDWVAPAKDGALIVDFKTSKDASPKGFAKAVANYSYDLQAALYSDGYAIASGRQVHGFVFAVCESEYPFAAAAYMLPDDVIDRARRKYRRLLNIYAECLSSGKWPGFTEGDEIKLLEMPAWALREDEE